MSFLEDYKYCTRCFLFFGLCPFQVNEKANFKYFSLQFIYSTIVFLLITTLLFITTTLNIIKYGLKNFESTYYISEFIQLILVAFIYIAMSIFYLYKAKENVQFLNAIVAIDFELCSFFGIQKLSSFQFIQTNLKSVISIVICYTTLNMLTMWNEYGRVEWHEQLSIVVQSIIMMKIFLIVMYIRFCAFLLEKRYEFIENKLIEVIGIVEVGNESAARSTATLMHFMKKIFQLKRKFERTFSTLLLWNFSFDLLYIIVCLYYFIYLMMYSEMTESNVSLKGVIFFGYFFTPILKEIYLITSFNSFGRQVNLIKCFETQIYKYNFF